jgi:spore coat polysaccharide biosynthesis predicted glycosyltransferase SpsG
MKTLICMNQYHGICLNYQVSNKINYVFKISINLFIVKGEREFKLLTFTIICKGSVEIGMGHLFRAKTFAKHLIASGYKLYVLAITDEHVRSSMQEIAQFTDFVESDKEAYKLLTGKTLDFLVFDTIQFSEIYFKQLKIKAKHTTSLSPVFNCMSSVDSLFTRLENQKNIGNKSTTVFAGLEYAIINDSCKLIPQSQFEQNLSLAQIPIGISMGGGDAPNKTKRILEAIVNIEKPLLLWVFLGEGYNHSYNDLVEIIKKDKKHEIILARTNRSLWYLLGNCTLVVLAGGLTYTEAVYAGLPTINLFESEKQAKNIPAAFQENNLGFNLGVLNDLNLKKMSTLIEELITNKDKIIQMRSRMSDVLDKKACERILLNLKEIAISSKIFNS